MLPVHSPFLSKYDFIMGIPTDKVEYNRISWYSILISGSLVADSFSHSAATPVKFYSMNHVANDTDRNQDLEAESKSLSIFALGFHSRATPTLFAILLGILHYRDKIPLTMKSILYPIMRDSIYGWIGDLLDFLSLISTMSTISIEMASGIRSISTYMKIGGYPISNLDSYFLEQCMLVTLAGVCCSVLINFKFSGIKAMSFLCIIMWLLVLPLLVTVNDMTNIILSTIEAVGNYLINFLPLGFKSDTFLVFSGDRTNEPKWPHHNKQAMEYTMVESQENSPWIQWAFRYWGWKVLQSGILGDLLRKGIQGQKYQGAHHRYHDCSDPGVCNMDRLCGIVGNQR